MGYFSQKKKQKRINIFLATALLVIALLLSVPFFFSAGVFGAWIDAYRFQIYVLTFLLLIYSLYYRRSTLILLSIGLLLFNYTVISASANLFTNVKVSGPKKLALSYFEGQKAVPEFAASVEGEAQRMGTIHLAPGYDAEFVTFQHGEGALTYVSLNFEHLSNSAASTVFDNLSEFVLSQDNPVILAGNFGIPAWSPIFNRFLYQTNLEVKNRILLTDGNWSFSPFAIPSVNLLAYKNVGIQKIDFMAAAPGQKPIIKFALNYD